MRIGYLPFRAARCPLLLGPQLVRWPLLRVNFVWCEEICFRSLLVILPAGERQAVLGGPVVLLLPVVLVALVARVKHRSRLARNPLYIAGIRQAVLAVLQAGRVSNRAVLLALAGQNRAVPGQVVQNSLVLLALVLYKRQRAA